MIIFLSDFTLYNSIYCSFIHCTVPEILFCACWSLLLYFSASFTNYPCETMATQTYFFVSETHKASNLTLNSDLFME